MNPGVAMHDDDGNDGTTTVIERYEKPKVLEESSIKSNMGPGSTDFDGDDLTLLDNLEWLINFPVGSLFPYTLDDEEEDRTSHRPENGRHHHHHRPIKRRNPVQSCNDGKSARKPGKYRVPPR